MEFIDVLFDYLHLMGLDKLLIGFSIIYLWVSMLANWSRDAKEQRLLDENETLHRQLDELEGHR